jgi:hypothetical protein
VCGFHSCLCIRIFIASQVYTPVGKKLQGCFALDMAIKTLSYYTKVISIPRPSPTYI